MNLLMAADSGCLTLLILLDLTTVTVIIFRNFLQDRLVSTGIAGTARTVKLTS